MRDYVARLRLDGSYEAMSGAVVGFDLKTMVFAMLDGSSGAGGASKIRTAHQDMERQFYSANQKIGEGLGMAYWKEVNRQGVTDEEAQMDVILVAASNDALESIDRYARGEFKVLYDKRRSAINALGEKARKKYEALAGVADDPVDVDWLLPENVSFTLNAECREYPRHLYVSEGGTFRTSLSPWESDLITEELKNGAHAWLRNLDRRSWSLEIPYRDGDAIRSMYPDLLVVSESGGNYKFGVLEPHDPSRADNLNKAKGMAEFAERHGGAYDRVQLIRKMRGADGLGRFYRLDMVDPGVRGKVRAAADNNDLDGLFETDARVD
jgi:type III restriction enzyme